jgi:hypothetical protein
MPLFVASLRVRAIPENWIDVERGRQAPTMSEQVYLQSNGFALIMLWYEPADDPEYDGKASVA